MAGHPVIVCIIQARMKSTRLPGKVLKEVLGKPLLWYLTERLRLCRSFSELVVATTDTPEDNLIADFCSSHKIHVYRGSENDVLDRYYQCARSYTADAVVRITADCPLIEPRFTDTIVDYYRKNPHLDLVRTGSTYPEGFDTEVIGFKTLAKAWERARLKSEREHVTAYVWKNEPLFKTATLQHDRDHSFLRLSVDEAVDFEVVTKVIESLFPTIGIGFSYDDIMRLHSLDPALFQKNSQVIRNQGYLTSIQNDKPIGGVI